MDIRETYRQAPIESDGSAVFDYALNNKIVADVRTQFGWHISSGLGGVVASALQHSHNHTSFWDTRVSGHGRAAAAGVTMVPSRPRFFIVSLS